MVVAIFPQRPFRAKKHARVEFPLFPISRPSHAHFAVLFHHPQGSPGRCRGPQPPADDALGHDHEGRRRDLHLPADRLAEHGLRAHHVEGGTGGKWVLLDYLDFVVHLFHPEARAFYQLERLWHDAPVVWQAPGGDQKGRLASR